MEKMYGVERTKTELETCLRGHQAILDQLRADLREVDRVDEENVAFRRRKLALLAWVEADMESIRRALAEKPARKKKEEGGMEGGET